MQGHESSITIFPENISFDHSSSSSDASIEPQIPWSSMQNNLQEFIMSSGVHQTRHESLTLGHALGETSSSAGQSQGDHIERKGARRYESTNNIPFDDVNFNANGKQIASGSSHPPLSGSEMFSRALNPRLDIGDWEDDDSQVIGSEDVPGSSFDGRRLPCKRKALETTQSGSSSEASSSNLFQQTDRSNAGNSIMLAQIANDLGNDIETGQANNQRPRRLGDDGSLSMSSRRSVRLRIDGPHQPEHTPINLFLNNTNVASVNTSSWGSRNIARLSLPNTLFETNPIPATEDTNTRDTNVASVNTSSWGSQNVARLSLPNTLFETNPIPATEDTSTRESLGLSHVSYARRNSRSSVREASGSRAQSSSASAISDENNAMVYEDPFATDPMLIPAFETGTSSQRPINVNSTSGNNGNNSSNHANHANVGSSSSRAGSSRTTSLYNRRVSEFIRRSLLSSASTEAEGQRSNHVMISDPSSSSSLQETSLSSGNSNHMQRRIAYLEWRLQDALGLPQSSQMADHIHHLLDLVQRGEDLTLEDVMLNHSIFFSMADLNDRHHDMRMDVDNMSYEELLALGEQIGDVCTGLKEEVIMSHLKQCKFAKIQPKDVESEPCSICREEYSEGDDIGTLDCGHNFHTDCVKQWLVLKNLCPICKMMGLNHHE